MVGVAWRGSFVLLINEEFDAIIGDLGDEVNDPENEVDRRNQGENSDDQRGGVLGFKVTKNSENTADDSTEEDLKQDLGDLRQTLVGCGQAVVCHRCISFTNV